MGAAVSVIVPVFNGEDTIERCIDSICRQTLRDIEIIVVNDGSDDKTAAVLPCIGDDRITVINQPNRGQGMARNAGVARACGEYIAFVDADDTIDADMLEVMYSAAKRSGADVVQCNITDIYPDGSKKVQLRYNDMCVDAENKGAYTDRYFSVCVHSYEVCNKLIKRDIFDDGKIMFRDTKKYFSEDLMFNMELIPLMSRICFISKPYYNYYQNSRSHFHSDFKKRLESICVLFEDYFAEASEEMRSAMSYTAAMVTLYNLGFCVDTCPDAAEKVLNGGMLRKVIKNALGRRCSFKHRLLLSAVLLSPPRLGGYIAKKYSERWQS